MNSRHSLALLVLIIVGVIAGLFVGWYWGEGASNVAWLGQLFLNTLSMLVIPLLVSAVITGVTSLGDVRHLGRIAGVTITYYLITVAIAVLIGLVLVNLIQPGVGVSTEGLPQTTDLARLAEGRTISDVLLSMVAPNLIRAAADTNLLPLILWSVALGIALASIGKKGRAAARFFESFRLYSRPANWYPSQPIKTLGSIWENRCTTLPVPNSGAQLDQTAPRLAVARKATRVSGILGSKAATRSPRSTPNRRNPAAAAATSSRSSANVSCARGPSSETPITAG
jgi:hypothetical protein